MKRLATYITLLVAVLCVAGCSHNNGDIGYWFGLWHLDSIEIDGTTDTEYDGNTYFMFQGKVFGIRCVDEVNHSSTDSFAQWQESDDHQAMTLTFVDSRFAPTISSHVPLEAVTTFTVVTLTDKDMVLQHTFSTTGTVRTYHLTHWE